MQLPLIGNGITVKNLKNIINQLDDSTILSVDNHKNLVVLEKDRIYESDTYIDLYYEEVRSYKALREAMKDDDYYKEYGN